MIIYLNIKSKIKVKLNNNYKKINCLQNNRNNNINNNKILRINTKRVNNRKKIKAMKNIKMIATNNKANILVATL